MLSTRPRDFIFLAFIFCSISVFGQDGGDLLEDIREENFRLKFLSILLGIVVVLLVLIFFNLKKKYVEKEKAIEIEKRFLRSQLNPHFIFNSLASIQQFIYSNDQRGASTYLSNFSKLIRLILENSKKDYVTLEDEISAIENYLQLQKMKFNNFDYEFHFLNLDMGSIEIPPMFIQPFLENCIEHGFDGQHYKGMIDISLKELDGILAVVIRDNGIGLSAAQKKLKNDKKSISTEIIKERIQIFQNEFHQDLEYSIESPVVNGKEEGTVVSLQLPFRKKVNESN